MLKLYSLIMDVFTHKRISPDCSLKSNQRPEKFSILTPRCAFGLRGVHDTAEFLKNVKETRWVRIMENNIVKKSRDTLSLNIQS